MTKDWERYRVDIINLYKQQNLPLREVRRILQDQYGFAASIRAYRSRFDKWRVSKYNCQRRRNSNSTQWSSDSDGFAPPPRKLPALPMLTGSSGPLPLPVPLSKPGGATGGSSSGHGSPYTPDLSPTASLSSYPGTPPGLGDTRLSYQDDGKLTSFPAPLGSLDAPLPRHHQPLSCILPQVHSQSHGAYHPPSSTDTSPGQSATYPYYGPPVTSSGYFDGPLPRFQGLLHDSVKPEY